MKEKEFCLACYHMFVNDFQDGSPSVLSRHTCNKGLSELTLEVKETRERACSERLKKWDEWVAPHLGELVLDNGSISRLIGFADDTDDYYYVFLESKKKWNKDKDNWIQLCSCVGGFHPIKGKIKDSEYAELEERFKKFDEDSGIEKFLERVVGKKHKKTMFRSKYDKEDYRLETEIFLRREDLLAANKKLLDLPILIT